MIYNENTDKRMRKKEKHSRITAARGEKKTTDSFKMATACTVVTTEPVDFLCVFSCQKLDYYVRKQVNIVSVVLHYVCRVWFCLCDNIFYILGCVLHVCDVAVLFGRLSRRQDLQEFLI